jgi:hypothetical protein
MQAAVGYKMRFRNTLTTVQGVLDTYGVVRTVVEREPLKDVKIGGYLEARIGPSHAGSQGEKSHLGFRITVGATSPIGPPLSPCTMSREIFAAT